MDWREFTALAQAIKEVKATSADKSTEQGAE